MIVAKILVTVGGLGLIGIIIWFFFLSRKEGFRALAASGGYQEALITVKGGYTPDLIVVQRGKPVRLNFKRVESASCSEMVVFPDFNKSAKLPEGKVVPIEFVPQQAGEFEFACQMGMLRGKLVVE
ncbi:MAG: cupredoxin domain-containing protein [Deltaproteobacteria bacterium]|nr:cupredoxin domain-containing protein [Deltaproteobacteria bacterium]MBW2307640.1 cupredoxin domain-containing protein [Deltaproteobacteria bacterium]